MSSVSSSHREEEEDMSSDSDKEVAKGHKELTPPNVGTSHMSRKPCYLLSTQTIYDPYIMGRTSKSSAPLDATKYKPIRQIIRECVYWDRSDDRLMSHLYEIYKKEITDQLVETKDSKPDASSESTQPSSSSHKQTKTVTIDPYMTFEKWKNSTHLASHYARMLPQESAALNHEYQAYGTISRQCYPPMSLNGLREHYCEFSERFMSCPVSPEVENGSFTQSDYFLISKWYSNIPCSLFAPWIYSMDFHFNDPKYQTILNTKKMEEKEDQDIYTETRPRLISLSNLSSPSKKQSVLDSSTEVVPLLKVLSKPNLLPRSQFYSMLCQQYVMEFLQMLMPSAFRKSNSIALSGIQTFIPSSVPSALHYLILQYAAFDSTWMPQWSLVTMNPQHYITEMPTLHPREIIPKVYGKRTTEQGMTLNIKEKHKLKKRIGQWILEQASYRKEVIASDIHQRFNGSQSHVVHWTDKDLTEVEHFKQKHGQQWKPIGWIDIQMMSEEDRRSFHLGTQYGVFHELWPDILTFKNSGVYFLCFNNQTPASFKYEMWVWFRDRLCGQFRFVRCLFNWTASEGYVTYDREYWCSTHTVIYLKRLSCKEIHNFLQLIVGSPLIEIYKKAIMQQAKPIDVLSAKTYFPI